LTQEEVTKDIVAKLSKALETDMFSSFAGREHERGLIKLLQKFGIKSAKHFHRPLIFEGLDATLKATSFNMSTLLKWSDLLPTQEEPIGSGGGPLRFSE
jgi:hypothetical protein